MNKLTLAALVAALAVAGCGGKKSGSGSACGDAIGKGVDQMIKAMQDKVAGADMPEQVKARVQQRTQQMVAIGGKLKDVITKRCVEDKWSSEVISCYASAASVADMRTCRAKLPSDQQARLQQDEMTLMMGSMGRGPGMGGPGMGGPGMGGPGMGGPGMGGMPPGHPGMGGPGMRPGMVPMPSGSGSAAGPGAEAGSAAAGSAAAGSAAAGSAAKP